MAEVKNSERLATMGTTAELIGADVRSPLQSLVGQTYLLNNEIADLPNGKQKDSIQECISEMETSLHRINFVIADLQDYAIPRLAHPLKTELYLKETIN